MCKRSGMSQCNKFSNGGVHSVFLGRERRERLLLPGDQDTLQELTFKLDLGNSGSIPVRGNERALQGQWSGGGARVEMDVSSP